MICQYLTIRVYKLCFEDLESNNVLITLIFTCLNKFLASHGSRGMITTLAFWHCAYAESPDVIRPLAIFSGELCSTLFVPPRMKTYFMLQLLEKFKLFSHHSMFSILSPWIPKFNVLKDNYFQHQGTCLNLTLKNHQSILLLLVIPSIKNYVV